MVRPSYIRRSDIPDAANVVAGINAICAEGGAFYTTHFVSSRQWQQVLYQPEAVPDHLLIVAERDNLFMGAGRLFPGKGNTLSQHVAELGMFVLEPYRRQGVGTQMLAWILNWASGTGIEKVTLSVFATNQPALHLYHKFNFIQEGRLQRHIKLNNEYIDFLLMSRFLQFSD